MLKKKFFLGGLYNHDVLSSEKRYVPLQMFTHEGIISWVLIQNHQHGLLNRAPNTIANCLETWLKGNENAEARRERNKINCIASYTPHHNLLSFNFQLFLSWSIWIYVVTYGSSSYSYKIDSQYRITCTWHKQI